MAELRNDRDFVSMLEAEAAAGAGAEYEDDFYDDRGGGRGASGSAVDGATGGSGGGKSRFQVVNSRKTQNRQNNLITRLPKRAVVQPGQVPGHGRGPVP